MAILNEWGNPYTYRRAARSANNGGGDRPYETTELKDIGKLVPQQDRKTLLSASRKLFLNLGPARGAIEQKAMYAVGRAWGPRFTGDDSEFGKAAKDWLENEWYGIGDVRSGMYDFKTCLYLISVAIDRDGEAFVLLTQTKEGYPRYQHIPAHQIATPYTAINSGEIVDGIEYHQTGAPKFYHVTDETGRESKKIPAQNIIHLYDPSWQEQGRGLPAFTHAINDLRDMQQSHDWERMAQLMLSSIGLIETNEAGAPDDDNAALLTSEQTTCQQDKMTVERMDGGSIRYFRAGTGSKIETIKSDRPGPAWTDFHDRIIRSALCGINWPYSLVWKATGQGTAERSELAKAQRAIEDRQDVLLYAAHRLISYAVAKAQKNEILPQSPDWWKWKFNFPAKITIDDGRVAKELIEGWKAGYINEADILGAYGKDLETHLYARAEEVAMRKTIAEEVGKKYGVKIEEREMAMLTPNDQSEAQTEAKSGKKSETNTNDNQHDE